MKGLAVTAVVLAAILTVASQALAQQNVVAIGVLKKPEATSYMYGTHATTDEASGVYHALGSESVDLDAYTGWRVIVYCTPVSGYEVGQIEGGPPLLDVT
jgi:hypothetical protein